MRWWLDAGNGTIGVPEIAFALDKCRHRLPPRGVWPHAPVAIIPDVVFGGAPCPAWYV
jgi:hypothetical protein